MSLQAFALAALAALAAGAACLWVLRAYRPRAGEKKPFAWAAAACACALVLYAAIGSPLLPGWAYVERLAAIQLQAKQHGFASLAPDQQIAFLRQKSKEAPNDPRPLVVSGLVYAGAGDDKSAARAFDVALRRDPDNAIATLELGRALTRLSGGAPSPQALELFRRAAEQEPDNPTPWLYQALAAMQRDDRAEAARLFGETLKRLPPDDPRRAMAKQMIAQLRAPAPVRRDRAKGG